MDEKIKLEEKPKWYAFLRMPTTTQVVCQVSFNGWIKKIALMWICLCFVL